MLTVLLDDDDDDDDDILNSVSNTPKKRIFRHFVTFYTILQTHTHTHTHIYIVTENTTD